MIIPMNAKAAKDKQEKLMDDDKYIGEIKLDGYRATFEDGEFYSRLGNPLGAKVPHLVEVLKEFNVVLDGELCMSDATSNSSDVTKILGSLPEKALVRQEELGKLRYVVFDVLAGAGKDFMGLPWNKRRQIIEDLCLQGLFDNEFVDVSVVHNDKRGLLRYAESNGLEGIMLKNVDAMYYPDKRPENTWYKVKKSMTYDVVCTGFTAGQGKYKSLIGAIVFSLYQGDTLVECGQCSGMDDAVRRHITENPMMYLNHVLEISAMERTDKGHFRHPVAKSWRNDKTPKECQWQQC